MKIFLIAAIGICSLTSQLSFASLPDPQSQLLEAVTLCPSPNNPLSDGLKAVDGDLFQNVQIFPDRAINGFQITFQVLSSPHAYNPRIMAPDKIVGQFSLVMGHNPKDGSLICSLSSNPRVVGDSQTTL